MVRIDRMPRTSGFGLLELLVVVVILVAAFSVAFLLGPDVHHHDRGVECMNNVKQLVGLLEIVRRDGALRWDGANLALCVVSLGDIEGEQRLNVLFCPVDSRESLKRAGGPEAYERLDLTSRDNGHLTSYAGRRTTDPNCLVSRNAQSAVVLICDDSEDHHGGRGYVVGLSGNSVKWRAKVEDWGLAPDAKVVVGPDSIVEELRCVSAD